MNLIKKSVIVLSLMVLVLSINAHAVLAQTPAQSNQTKQVLFLPGSSQYGNLPAPVSGGSAQAQFAQLAYGVVNNVRYVLGALAIAMIIYSGIRMVTGWGNDDVYTKQRTNLLWAIIGLAVVGLAGELSRILFVSCGPGGYTPPGQTAFTCEGNFLSSPNNIVRASTLFSQRTQIIITFIKYFIGGVAVLMLVRNSFRMVTMGGSEDKIALDKKNITYNIIGLILIIVADNVINQVVYKLDSTRYPSTGGPQPAIDAARGVQELVGFTNLVVSIVGPVAIISLVIGGVMYMTAAGKEETMEKAKRLIIASIVGIIIIYGAFAIISTFIAGNFSGLEVPSDVTAQ